MIRKNRGFEEMNCRGKSINGILFLIIAVLFIGVLTSSVKAWPVGNGIAVCTAQSYQMNVQLAPDGNNGAYLVWEDWPFSQDTDIYVQRVYASGTIASGWPVNGIAVCTARYDQGMPKIVSDGQGGAIIAWYDYRSSNYDIYAQRIGTTGNILWALDGIAVCTAAFAQWSTQIVADGQGGAIIVWQDGRNGNNDIYAQRIDSTGNIVSGWAVNGVAVCTTGFDQASPQLISDGLGGAIFVWQDYRNGTNYDIYAQRIDASGNIVSGWPVNGVAICTAGNIQYYQQLTSDGQGGAIISWTDSRTGASGIYAQRVYASGTIASGWLENGIAVCTTGWASRLISDGQGGAFIAWQDARRGNVDIYAQRINSIGSTLWMINGIAICTAGGNQYTPQLVSDGLGSAIITWQDERSGKDIYAQRVYASGTIATGWLVNGVEICTEGSNQWLPQLVSDNRGGAIIAWEDSRNASNYDIYAQSVNADGTIPIELSRFEIMVGIKE